MNLELVDQNFRQIMMAHLLVRLIFVCSEARIGDRVFLDMLAYYPELYRRRD